MARIKVLSDIVIPGPEVMLGDRLAAGQYDEVDERIIVGSMPLSIPMGQRHLTIVCFQRKVYSRHVEHYAGKRGYNLGLLDDLLAISQHPIHMHLQMLHTIHALGSFVRFNEIRYQIPHISCVKKKRRLGLYWYDLAWPEDAWFVLVKRA